MKKLVLLALILFLAACGSSTNHTTDDVITSFKDAGLEVENTKEMTKEDYGIAPMKTEEGVRFIIPSLGEDSGGRILSYDNDSDLQEMKEYYDSMGEESALFFSWTIQKDNILVQINGDLPEEQYNKYKSALESLE